MQILSSKVFHKQLYGTIFPRFSTLIETFLATRLLIWNLVPKLKPKKFAGGSILSQLAILEMHLRRECEKLDGLKRVYLIFLICSTSTTYSSNSQKNQK